MQERELHLTESSDRDLLTSALLRYYATGDEGDFWTYEALALLIDEHPTLAWLIILDLLHRAPTRAVLEIAAAGPLEDLIAWHGREVIELVEQSVVGDEPLRNALPHVWLNRRELDRTTLNRYVALGVRCIG